MELGRAVAHGAHEEVPEGMSWTARAPPRQGGVSVPPIAPETFAKTA